MLGVLVQIDMHYYGTYAMAVAAGIPKKDAAIVAYSAQFVDDSTRYDSGSHSDGGFLFGITTAHHPSQVLTRTSQDHLAGFEEQRRIWIPFHFFPGGEGDTFYEKLLCTKDGKIIQVVLDNYIENITRKPYRLELLGICAHVYADTFSHYGFSGMSSHFNKTNQDSFTYISPPSPSIQTYILKKLSLFKEKFVGDGAEMASEALGHGSVATMPDRPYLHWRFEFENPRPSGETVSDRNNTETYYEACKKLYEFFTRCGKAMYPETTSIPFATIQESIYEILKFEGNEKERSQQWINSGLVEGLPQYDPTYWENDKTKAFKKLNDSKEAINTNVYRFHQAAAYHRYYVLKDLLPSHGIAVY